MMWNKVGPITGSLLFAGIMALSLLTTSCSEKAEKVSAYETAEQMQAAMEGRNAAKTIVTKEWKDTMQMQLAILEARAGASKYEIENKPAAKAAFDSAFFSTIRTVRPELAKELEKR